MREFVIATTVGCLVAIAWLGVWSFALRAFGFPILARTPEKRALLESRIRQLGKAWYMVVFGASGRGIAFGLGFATAQVLGHGIEGWRDVAAIYVICMLAFALFGSFDGVRIWNALHRPPVTFPPDYPPQKAAFPPQYPQQK